jgi:BioD-like phosphotransacetylase family protein
VAATGQDQGKTTVSLGLMAAFNKACPPVGFIKPVGQRYIEVDGVRVDEDVALMRTIFPCDCPLGDMSPVTVGRSFTRDYIRQPRPAVLNQRILDSFERMSMGRQSIVIEGTGHAGVGSVFDTSNADVAHLLGADVILVAGGGIGKPIDEVMLNQSLFADRGVKLIGVILNKVVPSKLDEIRTAVTEGLGRKGIDLLGCIPYEPDLAKPSIRLVAEEFECELINGPESLGNVINSVIVGAMAAHRALEYVRPGCLLITPGDRDDLILAVLSSHTTGGGDVAGLLLTGGVKPQKNTLAMIARTQIPVMFIKEDSYTAASAVHSLKVKIQPVDAAKTALASRLVREYVDLHHILDRILADGARVRGSGPQVPGLLLEKICHEFQRGLG